MKWYQTVRTAKEVLKLRERATMLRCTYIAYLFSLFGCKTHQPHLTYTNHSKAPLATISLSTFT
jgi:hypothetical protein